MPLTEVLQDIRDFMGNLLDKIQTNALICYILFD